MSLATKPRYQVLTWDWELHKWTPQQGVRRGSYSLWGLRRALRKLRSMGYPCNYSSQMFGGGDPSVSVERIDSRMEAAA